MTGTPSLIRPVFTEGVGRMGKITAVIRLFIRPLIHSPAYKTNGLGRIDAQPICQVSSIRPRPFGRMVGELGE